MLRVVVSGGGRLDRVEARHRDRGDRRLRRAGDHDVRLAVLDHLVAVADRVDPGRAPGRDHHRRAVGSELERDLAGQAARNQTLVEERGRVVGVDQPLLATIADRDVAVLEGHRPSHGRAQADPHAIAVGVLEVERGVVERLHPRGGRELDVAVHPASLVLAQAGRARIEVDLRRDLGAEPGRVEEGDLPRGRTPGRDALPEGIPGGTARGDDADAGDRGAPHSVSTCPMSARGARGPRWKTMNASSSPSLRRRWRIMNGTYSASPALTSRGSSSRSAVSVPRTQ